ncbi:hypothetical protein [Chitinophaga sancti]|uniref:DUF2971 domain-containing protein n=1 Tax=Chitinophaga sancti TaxID=1004 RepID=A0A1K1SZ84_9BACT|nr:hypothetical protein [Chitinophaga sancti]WQD63935.1 hypothetical protein U0033_05965 [Chitinophaga sancti]WQG90440.1 hypothetical protein SR876_02955 [Chitinophaga sancti]SFW89391.1 hypothetical protein SAMN05661012_06424 [Chitinophaga sancti]
MNDNQDLSKSYYDQYGIPKKFVEGIREQVERDNRYQELLREADVLNKRERAGLVELINGILQEEKCPLINENQIKFYPQYIGNTGIGVPIDTTLTKIIYDHYYPPAPAGEYAHFTDLTALQSILTNRKLRLTSTIKRKHEFEFTLFYSDHDIEGFKRPIDNSTMEEGLMKDLFYISLTENKEPEIDIRRGMWQHFGKMGAGVKLIFDITTSHSDFRKVYYPNSSYAADKNLLAKLMDRISEVYGKPLVFKAISKFGTFYIDAGFEDECETRYLIKRYSDDYPFPFVTHFHGDIPFIELDFISPWGKLLPIKVQPGVNCNRDDVQSIVDASGMGLEVLPNVTSI